MGSAAVVEARVVKTLGGSISHGGIPQSGWFLMENPSKIGDMEVSPF